MEKVLALSELKNELIKEAVKKAIESLKAAKDDDVYTILLAKGFYAYPVLLQIVKNPHDSGYTVWANPNFSIDKAILEGIKRASIEVRVAKAFEDSGLAERGRKDSTMCDQLQQCLIQLSKDLCGSI